MSARARTLQTNTAEDVHLVALAVGFIVTDDATVDAWTPEQRGEVVRWMSYCSASASDHIVRKKNLIQPEFSEGIVRDWLGADDNNPEVQAWVLRVHAKFDEIGAAV